MLLLFPNLPSLSLLLTLGHLVASEVQVIYPQSLPTVTIKADASSALSDAIEVSTTTISQENYEATTQSPTTKTVFGYDDFVTTVDNTVMVFTPDANGGTKSISTSTASSIVSTVAQNL